MMRGLLFIDWSQVDMTEFFEFYPAFEDGLEFGAGHRRRGSVGDGAVRANLFAELKSAAIGDNDGLDGIGAVVDSVGAAAAVVLMDILRVQKIFEKSRLIIASLDKRPQPNGKHYRERQTDVECEQFPKPFRQEKLCQSLHLVYPLNELIIW